MPKILSQEGTSTLPKTWPFIDTRQLRKNYFDGGKFLEMELRKVLPSPLYWIQPDRKILWNLHLVRDYLLNGCDATAPSHQALVEAYLKTLPQCPAA